MSWGQLEVVFHVFSLKRSSTYANYDFLRKVFTKWVFSEHSMNVFGYQSHNYQFLIIFYQKDDYLIKIVDSNLHVIIQPGVHLTHLQKMLAMGEK